MADKHANMPGMNEPQKKSTGKEASDKPPEAEKAKPAPAPASADKPKHEH